GVKYFVERPIIRMDEIDSIAPGRQRLRGTGQRVSIAIQADQPGRTGFEQRPRVAAEAHGTIDEHAAALRAQMLQHFGGHDRDVSHQTPNSDSARASLSVYGSRCILVRKRW